jgi:sporulation protein YlmC with PRC-barrel domain
MILASTLEMRPIRTTGGRRIGHLSDLRCAKINGEMVITHLVYGRRGLLERFGFRGRSHEMLEWSRVVEIRPDVILIEDADPARR